MEARIEERLKREAEEKYPLTGDEREDMIAGFMRVAHVEGVTSRQPEIEELRKERNSLHKLVLELSGQKDVEEMKEFLKFKFYRGQI